MGYLTISGYRGARVRLSVPNDVIRNVYFEYFAEMMKREYQVDNSGYIDATDNMIYDKDITLFIQKLEKALKAMDNRDFIDFSEKIVKAIAMTIIVVNQSILAKSEYPVTGGGYIDILISPNQIEASTVLIELHYCAPMAKYIKKKDFSETLLKETRDQAYKQLIEYASNEEFQHKDVVKWILISHSSPMVSVKILVCIRKCYK